MPAFRTKNAQQSQRRAKKNVPFCKKDLKMERLQHWNRNTSSGSISAPGRVNTRHLCACKITFVQVTTLLRTHFICHPLFLLCHHTHLYLPVPLDLITATCCRRPAVVSDGSALTDAVLTVQTHETARAHGERKHT